MTEENRKCPKCGAEVKANEAFCGECGNKLVHQKQSLERTRALQNRYDNEIKTICIVFLALFFIVVPVVGLIYFANGFMNFLGVMPDEYLQIHEKLHSQIFNLNMSIQTATYILLISNAMTNLLVIIMCVGIGNKIDKLIKNKKD